MTTNLLLFVLLFNIPAEDVELLSTPNCPAGRLFASAAIASLKFTIGTAGSAINNSTTNPFRKLLHEINRCGLTLFDVARELNNTSGE